MTNESKCDIDAIHQACIDALTEFGAEMISCTNDRLPMTVALVCQYSDGSHKSIMAGHLNRVMMGGILQDLILEMFHKCKQNEVAAQIQDSVEKIALAGAPIDIASKPN